MSDYQFRKMYSDIKGPDWPACNNYAEFLRLPIDIKNACLTIHNVASRKEELESKNFWHIHGTHSMGLRHKNVVFVPVHKCGSTFYDNLLRVKNKWSVINLHTTQWDIGVGVLMHPFRRRIKGITEIIFRMFNYDYHKALNFLDSTEVHYLLCQTTMLDGHSYPYSILLEPIINKVNWVPLDIGGNEYATKYITQFLQRHDISISFGEELDLHSSNEGKIRVYNKIKGIIESNPPTHDLYLIYADDLKFYHNLLDKFYAGTTI